MNRKEGTLVPVTIDLTKRDDYVKGEPVRLVFTGDWHIELKCVDLGDIETMFRQEADKVNTYFVTLGDMLNFVTPDHPHANRPMSGLPHEQTKEEFLKPGWLDYGIEELRRLRSMANERIILDHTGNHDLRFEQALWGAMKNPVHSLANESGAHFGGTQTAWKIRTERGSLTIRSGHGYGGGYGEYTGALSNKIARMFGRYEEDLIVMGHYHQGVAVHEMVTGIGGKERFRAGLISPSMQRIYTPGQSNFGMSRWMPYRGVGYGLVKWVPENRFFKPEIILIPKRRTDVSV